MRMNSKQKGFTLIELIVSIAILGIIAVAFLPAFSTSFSFIAHAGNKSEALYTAQKYMENLIAQTGMAVENSDKMTITQTASAASIVIASTDGTPAITIQGRNLQVEVDYNSANKKALLKALMPDN